MMAVTIYSLCALCALLCGVLLFRGYRRTRYRLLLWSGLCFSGLTVNNLLLVADKILFPDTDLAVLRTGTAAISMIVLLYGLIWDAEA